MARKKPIRFRQGMRICWRDLLLVSRYQFTAKHGEGPFTVVAIDRDRIGPHPQILYLADEDGRALMLNPDCRAEFSGIWFRTAA